MATDPSELRTARSELRAWYLDGLRPKLARAVDAGAVTPAAVGLLDLQLRDLLYLRGGSVE